MKLYHPTKGLKGIRTVLNQFNEELLRPWQRDVLRERLLILRWYDLNERNQKRTAREFETSRSHIQKLIMIRKTEGLGGLIPKKTGPMNKRGFKLVHS
ncbi:helix-turn-helix domain-containing protein, partial [Candidatus Peregrinibacteria bacterium]|nr:helix-turn-helix domain-containing protein [Candidatus Peregrinibacteria bacterium]